MLLGVSPRRSVTVRHGLPTSSMRRPLSVVDLGALDAGTILAE
jgi:hypothetical protein